MSRPIPKTKIVSARMTAASLTLATATARQAGKSVSEWASDVLLSALTDPQPDFNTQVLLSETAATRASMVMLMQHAVNGTKITEDDLVSILEECDQARFTMAAGRLRDAMKVLAPSARKGAAQ